MTWRVTETLAGTVREAADAPRTIEGIAVPYGQVATDTELGAEAFFPGAFRDSVDHWMGRQDGGRMAYRPAHKSDPVGVVTSLRDTPEGVRFQAQIEESPEGDTYLRRVRAGLNGVSVEAGIPRDSKRGRDGTVIHRSARLFAIAGSVSPAYDGARIALRDMEEPMETETPTPGGPTPTPPPTPAPEPPAERDAVAQRRDAEREDPILRAISPVSRIVITRAEAIYDRDSQHSYMSDGYRAQMMGDGQAAERQARHDAYLSDISRQIERAGDVLSSEIPGAYPNDYLPGLLTPRILKGRPMGGFYNRIPISDARPRIFAKVTTSTTVAVQSAEGVNPAASDFATTSVTATPLLYGAETVVSRQVLDGGDPSGESMIIQDMVEAYAQASETVIKTAVEAGASASGSAITAATPYAGLQANVFAYQAARFKPATGQFVPPALLTTAVAQGDTTGRPFYSYAGPTNSNAAISAGGAMVSALGVEEYLSWASTTNVVVTGRPEDYVIYESSIARFSYDAVTGPAGVRIGIWAYLVVGTRLGSLKVTAA